VLSSEANKLWYPRAVLFVRNAQRSLRFYTEKLGRSLDWNYEQDGRAFVFQFNLNGVEFIVNQINDSSDTRAGHGRIFIGLADDQVEGFWRYMKEHGIETTVVFWGEHTVAIYDLDGNEVLFWLSECEREKLRS
jgi:catechol 2,3-dioxygenase-like lactoylglutathione lyase family enzyme